ncbi:histone deacetylase 8-like [Sabethes cyaneus]|uniref:histone deacetylase 8-like n=1 Tax=Sabethes cyaneus TaxID=53552 RepID=UPI00237DFF77|nr:histone deacetylase 8-like [Sabethes cyaneus]
MSTNEKVYITGKTIHKELEKISVIGKRNEIVDKLVDSYKLLRHFQVIDASKCSHEDLLTFHSSDYVDCLKRYNDADQDCEIPEELQEYGIAYDCPLIENIFDFMRTIAGTSLAAANSILDGARLAINWHGGWHHAERSSASGFCYVNDIVIAIQRLRTKFQKILYIDLDIHHGDGVESAFCFSEYIMTVSFHQHEPGFFPGTGLVSDIGYGKGKGYTVNAPYSRNISGSMYQFYFNKIASLAYDAFQPHACVVQCGGDVIAGDRLGGANLLPDDGKKCVRTIMNWKIPAMFLGGGGYNAVNTAKYWTELTAVICNEKLDNDIPDNDFFLNYGPDFVLNIYPTQAVDRNNVHELSKNISIIKGNLDRYVTSAANKK